jgi:asparagine synthase (glutamine-hydrolysing)
MSGFVGILNLDGAPVDSRLLGRMTDFLAFRGPDAQQIWIDHHVGLGHTMLRTTFESEHERQPWSLDGQVWITADARVDAREELMRELASHGRPNLGGATDVELILHAYHVWGESCVDHLIGDFAFAIWDGPERRLFCARDHMGVKPLYYALVGNSIIFSSALDCISFHPAVSDKLNELAIADFLLCGFNQDPATTVFDDIQRLPPAHIATWSQTGFLTRRYWTLPIDGPISYSRPGDYVDRFRELLRIAVGDRLRTNWIGVFMSGGLDSPALAATARDLLQERSPAIAVQAFTAVYDRAMPDQERHYSGMVAKHLGIPIHYWARDREMLIPWSRQTLVDTPEPVYDPFAYALGFEYRKQVAAHGRVFLYGEGPDNALCCDWLAHLARLAKERRWSRLLPDFWFHVMAHRRVPFLGRVRNWLQGYRKTTFPAWFNEGFASRLELRARWEGPPSQPYSAHPTRPKAHRAMTTSSWQDLLDSFDFMGSRSLSEVRHPYLDIRMLRYLLALPAIPWCCNKHLSRGAMRGALPERVLRRPKSPLAKDPHYERARLSGIPKFPVSKALLCYVNPGRIPGRVSKNIEEFRTNMRPIGLAYWLRNLEHGKKCAGEEKVHETNRQPTGFGKR